MSVIQDAERAVSSVGRASRLHREGRRFESVIAHHEIHGLDFVTQPGRQSNGTAGPTFSDQRSGGRQYRSPEGRADSNRDLRRDPRQRRHEAGPAGAGGQIGVRQEPTSHPLKRADGGARRSALRGAALLVAARLNQPISLLHTSQPQPLAPARAVRSAVKAGFRPRTSARFDRGLLDTLEPER